MFGRRKNYEKYQRAFLQQQKRKAKEHRRYMDMKRTRRVSDVSIDVAGEDASIDNQAVITPDIIHEKKSFSDYFVSLCAAGVVLIRNFSHYLLSFFKKILGIVISFIEVCIKYIGTIFKNIIH